VYSYNAQKIDRAEGEEINRASAGTEVGDRDVDVVGNADEGSKAKGKSSRGGWCADHVSCSEVGTGYSRLEGQVRPSLEAGVSER